MATSMGMTVMLFWVSVVMVVSILHLSLAEEDAAYPSSYFETGGCEVSLESLVVDATRLQLQIDELAGFSDSPPPSVTRIIYTENDVAARSYIRGLMRSAGLEVREDAIGNIFGRWEGSEGHLGVVGSGSHTDAIPYSGKYDGTVGVIGAIEAIQTLRKAGFVPKRSLEVIMFTSEEPTRFGFGCLGSRTMGGSDGILQTLKNAVDLNHVSFSEAARQAGYFQEENGLETVALSSGAYAGFVELHIEQGPILEEEETQIGIVTAIAAPASIKVDMVGDGGHAGAVLMPERNDVGLAAAELALAVEEHVLSSGSTDTVGTTGVVNVHPGAVNSIPRRAYMEIDVRDIDGERRDGVIEKIRASAEEIAKKRHAQLTRFEIVNQDPPALSGEGIVQAAVLAAEELGFTYKLMISRAYHDSLFMGRVSPMGMIFIPCYKGYSHRPDEFSSLNDMVRGVQVLALTLAKLSME